jgi:hypothetical protein
MEDGVVEFRKSAQHWEIHAGGLLEPNGAKAESMIIVNP